eukprot:Pgem_evm1s17909
MDIQIVFADGYLLEIPVSLVLIDINNSNYEVVLPFAINFGEYMSRIRFEDILSYLRLDLTLTNVLQ